MKRINVKKRYLTHVEMNGVLAEFVRLQVAISNDLSDDERMLAQGGRNVPIHPSMVPSEGSDTQETEGDGSVRDPTGIGRGT